MEIKLTLDATPALLDVLSNMTGALAGTMGALRGLSTPAQHTQQATAQTSTAPAPIVPQQQPAAQVPPPNVVQMPTPVAVFPVTPPVVPSASAPAAPAAPAAAPAPAPAPAAMPATYTPQQINQACAPLIDAGKLQELRKIMQDQFGVNSLQNMTAEHLAEFVPIVRGMGAQI